MEENNKPGSKRTNVVIVIVVTAIAMVICFATFFAPSNSNKVVTGKETNSQNTTVENQSIKEPWEINPGWVLRSDNGIFGCEFNMTIKEFQNNYYQACCNEIGESSVKLMEAYTSPGYYSLKGLNTVSSTQESTEGKNNVNLYNHQLTSKNDVPAMISVRTDCTTKKIVEIQYVIDWTVTEYFNDSAKYNYRITIPIRIFSCLGFNKSTFLDQYYNKSLDDLKTLKYGYTNGFVFFMDFIDNRYYRFSLFPCTNEIYHRIDSGFDPLAKSQTEKDPVEPQDPVQTNEIHSEQEPVKRENDIPSTSSNNSSVDPPVSTVPSVTDPPTTTVPPPPTVPPVTDPPPTTVPPVTFHESQKWQKAVEKWNQYAHQSYAYEMIEATGSDGGSAITVHTRIRRDGSWPDMYMYDGTKIFWDFRLSANNDSMRIEGVVGALSFGDISMIMNQAAVYLNGGGSYQVSNWGNNSGVWTDLGSQGAVLKRTKTDGGVVFTIQYSEETDIVSIEIKKA